MVSKKTKGRVSPAKYKHVKIEKKWQEKWLRVKLYSPDILKSKKPFYNLWMFPYPSAEGLHAGHAFASTGSDIYARFRSMKGDSVFQPIGYDSFGIHSENYALKVGEHPHNMLRRTMPNYERQMKSLGHMYDWTHTVTTSDVDYYRWTQWIFVQLFRAGLAYRAKSDVNWCPSCKTVLADEQVVNEKCERCHSEVKLKALEQWFFRITDYAERLLSNLGKINWSKRVVTAQRNWIGKKEGIVINYPIFNSQFSIKCFTTRPDTNFGATFVVLAPEHPLAEKITTGKYRQRVKEYIKGCQKLTKEERISAGRDKTGVFTGEYAINALNDIKMPIWISDFVLMDFGTGAVVGVPGHDKRDFEFAQKYKLPIERVVVGSDGDKSEITRSQQVQEAEGVMINSEFLDGLNIHKATQKMMDHIEEKRWGKRETTYHLRDWLISRQRYWGPPIPMIYCERCAKAGKSWFTNGQNLLHKGQSDWNNAGWYPEENLPVELPFLEDYKPKGAGRGPLADHPEFYEVDCPECGAKAKRETDVSDTFLDSSWYFLRYPSVRNNSDNLPWDPDITKKWLPVDLYFGGAEHSVLHLMYARFITQALYDLGLLEFDEPFPRFFAHGLMIKDGAKMSKSRGNVVSPDKYINKYGADTLRLYLMFMGPMDGNPDFRDTGIEGMKRFVERVWDLFSSAGELRPAAQSKQLEEINIKMHQTIKKVTEDIEKFHYNTAIAAIMEYVNILRSDPGLVSHQSLIILAQLLAPFTPHLAEEVWVNVLGEKFSIHKSAWPQYDPKYIKTDQVEIIVQVDGKLRGAVLISSESSKIKKEITLLATNDPRIQKWLGGKKIKDTVFVPERLVNFVTK